MNELGINSVKRINRDGTSQGARLANALSPTFYQLDDRNLSDLTRFAKEYTKSVQYYDDQNMASGTWELFFQENQSEDQPHYALYLAFLQCYKHAQAQLNTVTKRHLDLYLEKIVRMKPKAAISDKAYVTFQLAKNQYDFKLGKGTLLHAGKDNLGKPLFYETPRDKDTVLNKATIQDVKSAFLETIEREDGRLEERFYSSESMPDPQKGWLAFGKPQSTLKLTERTMGNGALGFALSSPLFNLQGGKRTITVRINCKKEPDHKETLKQEDLVNAFLIQLSLEKAWSDPILVDIDFDSSSDHISLTFELVLDSDFPAFVSNEELFSNEGLRSSFPLMKVYLNPDQDFFSFKAFESLSIQDVTITAKVEDFPHYVLQNDLGRIDTAKPFSPFGLAPKIGASLYLGSKEIFSKPISQLDIDLEWMDLPLLSLEDHYAAYGSFKTEDFAVSSSILEKKKWNDLKDNLPLFESIGGMQVGNSRQIALDLSLQTPYRPADLSEETFRSDTTGGFLRLELSGPRSPMRAFGHGEFVSLNTSAILAISGGDTTQPIPNQPYTPTIKSLQLSYLAEETVPFFELSGTTKLFHLEPFGNKNPALSHPPSLFAEYSHEGYLFLGIGDMVVPQNLSILFEIADGTADPQEDTDLLWSYLTANGWIDFVPTQILSDTTEKLQVSGIIELEVPGDVTSQSSLMPTGKYWIRGRVSNHRAVGQFISLHTQAILATFVDNENDPYHLSHPLPKERINKLALKNAAIKKVYQPFSSSGGRAREEGDDFYVRASERLRHKQRAVSAWDYERMILERFPSVYKVKCLTHTSKHVDHAPGHITVVVVPKVLNRSGVNTLAPKTPGKTLVEIKKYLERYVSDWVDVDVINPDYQEIQVNFEVGLVDGVDTGYYLKQLNSEIIEFLSPWITDSSKEIVFGGKIYKSAILDFVERREYVNFITDFKFYFQDKSDGIGRMALTGKENVRFNNQIDFEVFSDSEVAEPRDGKSVLISATNHVIRTAEGVVEFNHQDALPTEFELADLDIL